MDLSAVHVKNITRSPFLGQKLVLRETRFWLDFGKDGNFFQSWRWEDFLRSKFWSARIALKLWGRRKMAIHSLQVALFPYVRNLLNSLFGLLYCIVLVAWNCLKCGALQCASLSIEVLLSLKDRDILKYSIIFRPKKIFSVVSSVSENLWR